MPITLKGDLAKLYCLVPRGWKITALLPPSFTAKLARADAYLAGTEVGGSMCWRAVRYRVKIRESPLSDSRFFTRPGEKS